MPTFKRCDEEVTGLALAILTGYDTYGDLLDAKVRVDYAFAYADRDDEGHPKGNALTVHGVRALGQSRVLPLKDRAMGRGDAEITLDADWWENASEEERKAVMDHELHHLVLDRTKDGAVKFDDLSRPKLKLRKHDFQFGWFKIIAARHGAASQECIQAKILREAGGQLFWGDIVGTTGATARTLEYVKKTDELKGAAKQFVKKVETLPKGSSMTISSEGRELATIQGKAAA